ncbi:metal ABC transporter permease [Jeotgalicoccus coquinae]|uniref:Manganese transport system membrane protein MntB n=1 Tax=Jeotgalicoccus coquinae TaxID=709509 RepID=A0A6V7R4G3_9STAP|nr:iron chelate uptake ABC transporter family permease subunit [Jeotgalicoccus coquinae]MBB6423348.1 manganese/zinc/iron transport system permease protein [Jeotgalicoccus coquinae]GGE19184.1 metal ABC transporter permease [Jeotgalicoccus coquinae]CAD2071898.1 Manganese transport system membrane protein MntB [Jeotgalicoccus coquinae]
MDILTSYSFLIVAIGTVILSAAAGIVGTISVIKGQSLIGDAIGHATFPGVVLAFMLFNVMETSILVIGAVLFGIIAFQLIHIITGSSKITLDSALALVLSGFFGLGMALKSYVQGNPYFSGTQGIDDFIFGQAAYMLKSDVYLIIAASVVSLVLFFIHYQQLKIYTFDPVYARTVGISIRFMNVLVLAMTIMLIAVGLKAVGAVLIVNILIAPAVTGTLWSNKFMTVLIIAAASGGMSAFIGTYISTALTGIATGPAIILALSVCVVFSMLFAPKGILAKRSRLRKLGEAV